MPEPSGHAADIAMKGGGYYSLATIGAKDVIDAVTPMVLEALSAMDLRGLSGFTMSDMGCADGGTSIDMVGKVLSEVRRLAPALPLSMVYSDQPGNDYNTLFQILRGATEIRSPLPEIDDLHVFASATSFYRRILPANSLNLGFSATAMHWLSAKPGEISNHVQAVGAQGEERAAFARQGREDWDRILLHRAAELAPGGALVFANFCQDEHGRYLGSTGGVNMFDTFNALWLALLDDGAIRRDEYVRMTLPQYYKTVEEFSAPLTDPSSAVHQAGLRLTAIETRVTPCPYALDFKRHGDAAVFAPAYIPTLRSWTESTFFGALDPERPREQRQEIVDRYYQSYIDQVRDKPDGHGMDYVHAFMTITKVP